MLIARIIKAALFAGGCAMAAALQAAEPVKPNVLVILMDDFGTGQFAPLARELEVEQVDPGLLAYTEELGEPYDPQVALDASRRAMPFMETLADQGVLFTRAFSASSLCAPARQGILTGTNPVRWGAYRNIDINVCGLSQARCLVKDLQEDGYATGFVGKWHVGSRDHEIRNRIIAAGGTEEDVAKSGYMGSVIERDHPLNNGFDYAFFYNLWECPFYDSELLWENRDYTGLSTEYNTDLFTRKAMTFMEQAIDEEKPFFVELALHSVHIPLDVDAPEAYASRFDTGSQAVDRFYSHIYGVDQSVRRIVDMLKERGQWDNTILFFLSDNGATCKVGAGDLSLIPGNGTHKGHKGQLYLGGIRIPMMMVWPGRIKDARVVDQNVSSMDILPTALVAAGVDLPGNIDGKDLLPVIENPELVQHEQLFWAGIHAPAWGYSSKYTLVQAQDNRDRWHGGWAIVEGDHILRYIGSLDPGLEADYPEGRAAFASLHNLSSDPLERVDLLEQEPEVAGRLTASYNRIAETLPPPHTWDQKRWAEIVPESNPQRRRPNLLYIFPDQFRREALGAWQMEQYKDALRTVSDPVVTPVLDKLAGEGILFTQAVSTTPLCSPHRAMFMSGMYPWRNGVITNCRKDREDGLRHDIECLTDVLARAGYETAYVGKTHWERNDPLFDENQNYVGTTEPPGGHHFNPYDTYIPPGPGRHGIKYWFQCVKDVHKDPRVYSNDPEAIGGRRDGEQFRPEIYSPKLEADVLIDYLKNNRGQRDTAKPFSIIWSLNPPHNPYDSEDDCDELAYREHYQGREDLLNRPNTSGHETEEQARKRVAFYLANVTGVDKQIGRVLQVLEEIGEAGNTIIVFTSDHGELMGSHGKYGKNVIQDESFCVPFLINYPGRTQGRLEDLMISSVDIMPTVLGLMGLGSEIPSTVEGADYSAGLLDGDWSGSPKPASALYLGSGNRVKGVRTYRYSFQVDEEGNELLFDNVADPYQMAPVTLGDIPGEEADFIRSELGRWLQVSDDPWFRERMLPHIIHYPR